MDKCFYLQLKQLRDVSYLLELSHAVKDGFEVCHGSEVAGNLPELLILIRSLLIEDIDEESINKIPTSAKDIHAMLRVLFKTKYDSYSLEVLESIYYLATILIYRLSMIYFHKYHEHFFLISASLNTTWILVFRLFRTLQRFSHQLSVDKGRPFMHFT